MRIGQYAIALALAIAISSAGHAQAQMGTKEVQIEGGSVVLPIRVHSTFITVLYFPSEIITILQSDGEHFIVQAKGRRVVLRPVADVPPDTVANIEVLTSDAKASIILRIASNPSEAVPQVVFKVAPQRTPGPSFVERLSLSAGGILGEASVDTAESQPTKALVAGAEARLGIQGGEYHTYEVSLAVAGVSPEWEDAALPAGKDTRRLVSAALFTRVLAGACFHFGERVRPRLFLGGGVQYRVPRVTRGLFSGGGHAVVEDRDTSRYLEPLMTGGIGIDVVVWRDWRVGLDGRVTRKLAKEDDFLSFEGGAFLRWL